MQGRTEQGRTEQGHTEHEHTRLGEACRQDPSPEPPAGPAGEQEPPGEQDSPGKQDLVQAAHDAAQRAAAGPSSRARRGARSRRGAAGGQHGGRGRRWSGARADSRDPQAVGGLLNQLAKSRGWHERLASGRLFGHWSQLVGSDIAEHTQPVSLRDGELTVQAESTAWATQLRLLQRQLLSRIAAELGTGVVRRLRVHGPATPSWRYGPRHVSGRGPRDTYG